MDEASFGAVVSSHALSAICTTPISPFGSLRGIPIGPEVSLELGISDRFVDIIREGFDIAIRMGSLADSDLVSRKIGDIRFVLAASPDYISRNSVPADLEALGRHVFVRYAASGRPWPYILADGTRLPTSGRFVTDDMARSGKPSYAAPGSHTCFMSRSRRILPAQTDRPAHTALAPGCRVRT
jgi:DNA-binding transcriptional LysR family regulator